MCNYTKPNDENHEDTPLDWLSSALIFAGALGNILKENEGIVVKLRGDMKLGLSWLVENIDKVIVYSQDNEIRIMEADDHLEEGNMVWIHGDEMTDFSNFEPDL